MSRFRRFTVPALIVAAALGGCGGGSNGGSTPPVTATPSPSPTPTPTPTPAPNTCASIASNGRRPVSRASLAAWVAPNRLYVTYRASAGTRATTAIDRSVAALRALDLGAENGLAHRAVTLSTGVDATTAAAQLRANPDVVDVEPVHVRVPLSVTSPSDPFFENTDQWYLFKQNAQAGWSLTQGNGVAIAVIDTGADETNADLAPKFDVRESIVAGVVATGAGSVQDTNGHGTNVAGLAAAATNNGYGFAGVSYNARLQIYKVFPNATATSDCQTADTADEARAIRDAVANGASVINLSLGSPPGSIDQAEQQAVEFALANNVTVVAAGGNDGGASPDYPGGYAGVIAVGASNVADAVPNTYATITSEGVASYSNSGVTLVAPGGDPSGTSDGDTLHWIEGYSTTTAALAKDRCSNSGGVCRVLFAGTSQSTPQVAGTVALMMAYHGGPKSLTPASVASLLTSTADSIGQPAARQGGGRLNIGNAVAAAHP